MQRKPTKALGKAEAKILSLFSSGKTEDGRLLVYGRRDTRAALKLQERGLVRCECGMDEVHRLHRGAYGRWLGGTKIHVYGWCKVWLSEPKPDAACQGEKRETQL